MPQVTYPNVFTYGSFFGAGNKFYSYPKYSSVAHTGESMGDGVKPYPFTRTIREVTNVETIIPANATAWGGPVGPNDTPWYFDARARARNVSYDRLRSKFHNDIVANLGETLGEWRTSLQMIGQRSSDLSDIVKRVGLTARGRWKTLPQRKRPRNVRSKAALWSNVLAGTWLEYSFGWAPMLGDLYASYKVLSSDIRPTRLYATSSQVFDGNVWNGRRTHSSHVGKVSFRQGASFKVVNPNLALMDQLGIINPASVAWALTRMSFFVDWCFDVNNYLRSFTDYAGVVVSDAYNTEFVREYTTHTRTVNAYNLATPKQRFHMYERRVVRQLGLAFPLPNMAVSGNLGHSLKRALNASSVLRLQFPKYWKQP